VREFLKCGDPHEGFARVRCPDCKYEYFAPFSCKGRCVCPSCSQKRTLLTGINIAENIVEQVPHRQWVWTMPKRLRIFFRFDRELLKRLPNLAWEVTLELFRAVLGRDDVVPGMVAGIQTQGRLSQWNPHTHCITTHGAFTADGTFIPLPDDLSTTPFRELWERKLFDFLLAEGKITQAVVDQMRSWRHSGFSVDHSVRLEAGDTAGVERLARYMVRCPFSVERILSVGADGKVVYRAEKAECRPFPVLGDERFLKGISRNFEVFDPLEFLAEITQHIPPARMQLVRYFGWYSNRSRGDRAKRRAESADDAPAEIVIDGEDTPYRKLARLRWAALLKRVFEVDPFLCPRCGSQMRVVSVIERRDQPEVVERILRHCGLWGRPAPRAPPRAPEQLDLELQYVDTDEFLMAL
jgi:hypothetical protein